MALIDQHEGDSVECDDRAFFKPKRIGVGVMVSDEDACDVCIILAFDEFQMMFPPGNIETARTLADEIYNAILEMERIRGTAALPATADAAGGKPVRTAEANSKRER